MTKTITYVCKFVFVKNLLVSSEATTQDKLTPVLISSPCHAVRHAILLESTTAGAIIDCFLLFVCVVFLPEFLYVFQPLLNVDIYDKLISKFTQNNS